MAITWTKTGEPIVPLDARPRAVLAFDALEWQPVTDDLTLPACPGLAIKACIQELRLPRVSHVAHSPAFEPYGLLGIRAHYRNGVADVYVVDRGSDSVVVASDFTPAEA
jgi:hypothetical protein